MATHDYVAVAADDWYQRRRRDDEGEFFRAVANQGPRKGGIDGDTRQGIYILTAGGKLLDYRNAGQNPEVMRETVASGRQLSFRAPNLTHNGIVLAQMDRWAEEAPV